MMTKSAFSDATSEVRLGEDKSTRKAALAFYYGQLADALYQYFIRNDYHVAAAAFAEIREEKSKAGSDLRRDRITPNIGHEVDQLLVVITSLEHGILKGKKAEIEAAHRPIDQWLAAVACHDWAEDFGVMPAEMAQRIAARMSTITESTIAQDDPRIASFVNDIEDLTHYRKFSPDEAAKIFGKMPAIEGLEDKEVIDLNPQLGSKFQELVSRYSEKNNYYKPRVFARWNKKYQQPEIVMTAYGDADQIQIDWSRYILTLMRDPVLSAVKGGDRIQGISTRISVPETKEALDHYLDATGYMFMHLGVYEKLLNDNPNSPLRDFWHSQNMMMGLIWSMARTIIPHHSSENLPGSKGFDPTVLSQGSFNHLFYSRYFPQALKVYEFVPPMNHPVAVFFEQFRSYISRDPDPGRNKTLYKTMVRTLTEPECGGIEILSFLRPVENEHIQAGPELKI